MLDDITALELPEADAVDNEARGEEDMEEKLIDKIVEDVVYEVAKVGGADGCGESVVDGAPRILVLNVGERVGKELAERGDTVVERVPADDWEVTNEGIVFDDER